MWEKSAFAKTCAARVEADRYDVDAWSILPFWLRLFAFPSSVMQKLWLPGEPMPHDLVDEIIARLQRERDALVAKLRLSGAEASLQELSLAP